MSLEVLEAGFLTTVQDAGRPAWTHLGVPVGGACDPWSLAVANLLAGNDAGAGALEMTLSGPTLAVRAATVVGLAGADLGGVVRETGERLAPGLAHRLEAGTTIEFPGGAGSAGGARAYLAPGGGVDVPLVLGSASTALAAGFGGSQGRPLRPGDRIAGRLGEGHGRRPDAVAGRAWPRLADDPLTDDGPIRVIAGPAAGAAELAAVSWRVATGSDRIGLRLDGPPLAAGTGPGAAGELLSHGVVWGAVQVPPGGAPIVLLADHQTTGGYPVVAVAIAADRPRLGQLRPGDEVRFASVGVDEAREALRRRRAALARGARLLVEDAAWETLWRSAGA